MKSPARVVTLTLHPAIDRVVKIETMQPGGTFDAQAELTIPAGKGVNTARVLRTLCGKNQDIVAAAWTGENEAHFFKTKLRELAGVTCAVCSRPVATRFATTYLEANGRETHIKEAMAAPTVSASRAFLEFWRKTVRKGDVVAVCGSAPKGSTPSFLQSVFSLAHERGVRAIIADTNGPALQSAATSGIALLKGNALEIGALLELNAPFLVSNGIHCGRLFSLLQKKEAPQRVLITLGSDGALLVSFDRILHCKIIPAHLPNKIVSTTGCGDASTAGAVSGILASTNDENILCRAVASGAAKTCSADPGKISLKDYRGFVRYCVTEAVVTR